MTRAGPGRRTEILFLACAFTITWEKIHWSFGGNIALEDILAGLFVVSFVLDRLAIGDRRVQRTTAAVLVFLAAFLLVYLIGFFNLDTKQALDQYVKGLVKFFLHFGLLACGVAYLARRSVGFYWRALTVFTLGLAANAAYGVLQLLVARAGHNLDHIVLGPLTGGASSINIYGAVNGASVYRPNALTGDPNHLGIMLLVPEAGGRGRGVLSGKGFEYLAAERPILAAVPPDGAAAELLRETGTAIVAPPDDVEAIRAGLVELVGRWRAGRLNGTPLPEELRERLSREARSEELADLLRSLA